MRRAGRPLGRRQIVDSENDLRQLPLRSGPDFAARRRAEFRPRDGHTPPDAGSARHRHRLCQPIPARGAPGADHRRDRRAADCLRYAARCRSCQGHGDAATAQYPRCIVAAAAGDLFRRRAAAGQYRAWLFAGFADPFARRADGVARRRQSRRGAGTDRRKEATRCGDCRRGPRRECPRGYCRPDRRGQQIRRGGLRVFAMSEQRDLMLTNAKIVLADRVIERGWLAVSDGTISEIGEGAAPESGEDFHGDLLLPGLVELHTDHLEAHYSPRPKVYWDPVAAVVSFDGQLATSGITTVLDSLRVWREEGAEDVDGQAEILAQAIG